MFLEIFAGTTIDKIVCSVICHEKAHSFVCPSNYGPRSTEACYLVTEEKRKKDGGNEWMV